MFKSMSTNHQPEKAILYVICNATYSTRCFWMKKLHSGIDLMRRNKTIKNQVINRINRINCDCDASFENESKILRKIIK